LTLTAQYLRLENEAPQGGLTNMPETSLSVDHFKWP